MPSLLIPPPTPHSPRTPRTPHTPHTPTTPSGKAHHKGRLALARASSAFFNPICEYHIPAAGSNWRRLISRWSDKNVSLPGVVVDPATESDIVAAIHYAGANDLKIVPASGGHGTFIPIDKNTLYLDMRKLSKVSIDPSKDTVKIEGGASTGQVLTSCAQQGFYTLVPNSNEVGMIGALLGGGSNIFNGRHGFMIDHVLSIRLVTGNGTILEVSPDSEGEEKNLFNALCGGGHGLGIILSITLRAFRIKNLDMDKNKIWVRKLIFPAGSIDIAAQLYEKLLDHPPEMVLVMGFARAPKGSPQAGAPMIILTVEYFGPSTKAKEAAAATFEPDVIKATIVEEVEQVAMERINDAGEQLNQHGGYKEMYSSLNKRVTVHSLKSSFDRWVKLGEECEDAKEKSYFIFSSWNNKVMIENGRSSPGKYFNGREKAVLSQAVVWYTQKESQERTDKFGYEIADIDAAEGLEPLAFANNLREGIDLRAAYSEEQLEELRRIKKHWDEQGLFWSPASHSEDGFLYMT